MNAEKLAKGLEKCKLLTTFLYKMNEKRVIMVAQKNQIQDLVKKDSLWKCSSYLFLNTTRLHCAERKAKVCGDWAMQHL